MNESADLRWIMLYLDAFFGKKCLTLDLDSCIFRIDQIYNDYHYLIYKGENRMKLSFGLISLILSYTFITIGLTRTIMGHKGSPFFMASICMSALSSIYGWTRQKEDGDMIE